MLIIALKPIPNQTLSVILGGQSCRINIYQKYLGMFCDLLVNDAQIIGGVLCENANRIVRSVYLGFSGDIVFYDTEGLNDPFYTGLGNRYRLLYLDPSDLATLGFDA